MNKSIIFLESATKKKTISSFLGGKYLIFATGGHLTELVNQGYYNLGINLSNFEPTYKTILGKKNLINSWKKSLAKEKNATIYLATDPDREGEGIAQEIVKVLDLSPNQYQRLLFYEITPRNVREALNNPSTINQNLVNAQTSRQILDRIIGFCLSPLLQKKLHALSAGRVQSVVLKLIVERERLIHDYKKKKEYIVCGIVPIFSEKIVLKQVDLTEKLIIYQDLSKAEEILTKLEANFQLIKKKTEDKKLLPKSPLTTSLLLFEAKSQLGFSVSKTTQLAQKLYEGIELSKSKKRVGLITYPRTDSTRINQEFQKQAYNLISQKWGREYCNFNPAWNKKEKKINVQNAHEAIHPTYLHYHPEVNEEIINSLSEEERKLYLLIFRHTLASLMAVAQIKKTTYIFLNNDYYFATSERISQFLGFLACDQDFYLLNYRIKTQLQLDNLSKVTAEKLEIKEYLENKPIRYNEGNLVQELERLGIGRPSTYNTFGRIIQLRKYAELNSKGQFVPTSLGFLVNEWLQTNFSSLINENYTANLEKELDKISCGENDYYNFIKCFWEEFNQHFQKVKL